MTTAPAFFLANSPTSPLRRREGEKKNMIEFLLKLDAFLWGPPLIILMLTVGLYFTIRSGFFQFRHFGYIMKRTGGQLFNKDRDADDGEKGLVTPFQAICTAIGGTVGFGNIAGVATAVAAGGPGALVWMWLTACLGMILKQVEVTLGCYYRRTNEKGEPYGGPTYYMERGLGEEKHWGKLWTVPAVIFGLGIFSTFFVTSGTLTAAQVVSGAFHVPTLTLGGITIEGEILMGAILVILGYAVTAGGTKRIGELFSKLVPVMSIAYIIMGLGMILTHLPAVPGAIAAIFSGAFTGTAAVGGFAGATVSSIISTGMARAVYSNEAGWGTSPMIHASAKTRHPVEQGLWGTFEAFFDTMVICTITGLSVVLSGCWTDGSTGGTLALNAFSNGFGAVGGMILAVIMIIFTVTTGGGWFTYYMALLQHLFKKESTLKTVVVKIFYAFRSLPGFLWTVYLVKTNNQGFIWTLVDITSAIPTFINVAVILLLSGQYFKLLKDYKARYMGIGTVDPGAKLFYED